jgi:hypothetical protein
MVTPLPVVAIGNTTVPVGPAATTTPCAVIATYTVALPLVVVKTGGEAFVAVDVAFVAAVIV